ncbi:hypothetical protein ANCDUO_05655 [Ancylostoma duodenale]|uniref:RNA-directed RNA polymerase n=1 Tax=Ancylostoma duodenale TaxID=51022 RepID=A0A0C2H3M8_9BILA|nr:hypothetical protein ANCDUO_05655 [Ancylostoma duodenale]
MLFADKCPSLSSPITDDDALVRLVTLDVDYYYSIDARKFDHQIPMWFVVDVIRMIGKVAGQPAMAEEEVRAIKRLRVELFGQCIKYRGSVLSGWRLISLIGSLASELLCRWIKCTVSKRIRWVMTSGDDVLVMSREDHSARITQAVHELGLDIKGDVRAGRVGVFLQRAYSKRGYSQMAMGGALKQLFYASPWVEHLQFTDAESLANAWLQVLSRIPGVAHKNWLLRQAAADMARWSRWPG